MKTTVSAADEGKRVIDANGDRIGTVERVDEGTPLVEPRAEVNPTVTRALGWCDEPGVVPLRPQSIASISESAIRLRSNL